MQSSYETILGLGKKPTPKHTEITANCAYIHQFRLYIEQLLNKTYVLLPSFRLVSL